jgi:hypothetical protein
LKKTLLFIILLTQILYTQDDDFKLGKTQLQNSASVFDISDPKGINIEVNLWGFVNFPGRYIIPYNSTLVDILSFSGGPTESSNIEEIRILRPAKDSLNTKNTVIKINYNDLLWGENVKQEKMKNPVLQSGDIIIVMEENRYSLRENISFIVPIVASIITLATFIITLSK